MKLLTSHQVLPFIQPYLPANPVIVEAGAFNGKDTRRLATFWPQGTIHSFEPVPEIFAQLTANTTDLPNVCRYQVALSNHLGAATFHVSEHPKKQGNIYPAGSLFKPKDRLNFSPVHYPITITVPTTTLDAWQKQYHIPSIDFLWLDLQGHELAVMQAAPTVLSQVHVIFTEVEFVQAYEHTPLYTQVQTWLETQGFVAVAKDFANTSDWFFGNMVFVHKQLL